MQNKYATYGLEDFVQDEEFIRWVKYPDRESNLFWSQLLETYPFQQETIHQAKQVVLKLSEAASPTIEVDDAKEIWNTLQQSISKPVKVVPLWQRSWTRVAAALVLLIGGLTVWQVRSGETNLVEISAVYGVLSGELTAISNDVTDSMIVKLPDNSSITLSRGARIRYKTNFDGPVREVYLKGEAFFDVTRNPKKPFIVYTNELVTKVLGTSFRIKSNAAGRNVTVAVKTGKVMVFKNAEVTSADQPAGLILLPNQKADYKKEADLLSRTLVDEPLPIVPVDELPSATFDNVPVAELFENLEKSYGIAIQFDHNLLTGCRLTTSFKNESLFQQLDVLCEAINASYKIEGTQIVIDAKRCQ